MLDVVVPVADDAIAGAPTDVSRNFHSFLGGSEALAPVFCPRSSVWCPILDQCGFALHRPMDKLFDCFQRKQQMLSSPPKHRSPLPWPAAAACRHGSLLFITNTLLRPTRFSSGTIVQQAGPSAGGDAPVDEPAEVDAVAEERAADGEQPAPMLSEACVEVAEEVSKEGDMADVVTPVDDDVVTDAPIDVGLVLIRFDAYRAG